MCKLNLQVLRHEVSHVTGNSGGIGGSGGGSDFVMLLFGVGEAACLGCGRTK